MLPEETIKRWREEALEQVEDRKHGETAAYQMQNKDILLDRILEMTQELLDLQEKVLSDRKT